jgi:hypothetical protein
MDPRPCRPIVRGGLSSLGLAGLCLVGVSLAIGCNGESPFRPPPENTRLNFFAILADTLESGDVTLGVVGWFQPGVTEEGRLRKVLDPRIRVMGFELQGTPSQGSVNGFSTFDGSFDIPDDGIETVALTYQPPEVQGVNPEYGPIEWYGPARNGPTNIRIGQGEDLRLDIALPERPSLPPPGALSTEIFLRSPIDETFLILPGSPPPTLVIPWELLPETADGTFVVRYEVKQNRGGSPPVEEPYFVHPGLVTVLGWTVLVE